jgi:glycerophosphoryl diester phosphodiesterase
MKNKILFIVIVLSTSCSAPKNTTTSNLSFASNPVIAHRGAFKKNSFPENSIAALREAIRLQCTGSEFDVRMSADDSLVINHDPKFQQMDIEKTTYAELSKRYLANGELLPTLRLYLTAGAVENPSTRLIVEIKPSVISKERGEIIAEKVVTLVHELKLQSKVVYISFDYNIVKKIRQINPNAITQYLNGDKTPEELKQDGINGADYHISVFQKNPDWITRAKRSGIALNAWTVNTEAEMIWLLDNKFDYITTNEPELLFEVLKKR